MLAVRVVLDVVDLLEPAAVAAEDPRDLAVDEQRRTSARRPPADQRLDARGAVDDGARLDRVRESHDLEQVRPAPHAKTATAVRAVLASVGAGQHLADALDVLAQRAVLVVLEAFAALDLVRRRGEHRRRPPSPARPAWRTRSDPG